VGSQAVAYKEQGYDFEEEVEHGEYITGTTGGTGDDGKPVEYVEGQEPDKIVIKRGAPLDHAMQALKVAKNSQDLGGIDLNQINVNREGKAVVVQFDPAQLNELMRDGFEGFMPVIINITPIQSPLPLLGVNPRKEEALIPL